MPHSLRSKIKSLRYKGIITDKDCERLCKALDNESVLDKIRAEMEDILIINQDDERIYQQIKAIIDKYRAENEDKDEISD